MNKYKNSKTELDGRSFGSKLEASVYCFIKAMGFEIIQCQDHVYLTDARILYVADFKCKGSDGAIFWAEAKGFETSDWRIKKRLWYHYGPGPLHIYKGTAARPCLSEIVTGK